VKRLSLKPDPDMRWIYDYTHPDYNSERAQDLRMRRELAIRNAPEWMRREAALNDAADDEPRLDAAERARDMNAANRRG
jgi:hypothetical protein